MLSAHAGIAEMAERKLDSTPAADPDVPAPPAATTADPERAA